MPILTITSVLSLFVSSTNHIEEHETVVNESILYRGNVHVVFMCYSERRELVC